MGSSDLRSEDSGYPCGWEPIVLEGVVVSYPVVEESEDVVSVVVPRQDGALQENLRDPGSWLPKCNFVVPRI